MKIIFYFLCLFFLVTLNANSEKISKIEIQGNKRITNETIKLFSGVNKFKNKSLSENDLNYILKQLYETDFFQNVNINLKNNILTINVIENPLIQSVKFEGIKNKKILQFLNEQIQLKERTSYLKNKIKNDESIILNILKGNGYYFVKVSSKINKNNNNTVDIIYDVNMGEKAHIKKIKFIGDKVFKDGKLKKVIISEEGRFWKFISNKKYLDVNRIKLEENLLQNFYKNKGYYNVLVESSSAKVINETDFELTFNINAGKKYFFNKVKINIPNEFDKNNFDDINKFLAKIEGDHYSLNKIEKILKKIDKIILNKEYQFLTASYKETTKGDKIDLTIFFDKSDKIYISRINILGNFITQEKVIRNKLKIDEGDPYNQILLTKSINSIKSSGIFKDVTKKVIDGDDNKKIINIYVEESPTGEIMAGAGTGSDGSSITFGIKEKNYLGKGIKLNSSFTLRNDGLDMIIERTDPNFKNSEKSLITSIQNSTRDLLTKFGYKNQKTGFTVGTFYEHFEDIYFSPTFSVFHEQLETSSTASAIQKKQEGDYFESDISYSFTLNKLNQNFQPSNGYKASFYQSIPLVSDDTSFINSIQFANYYSITDEMIFSLNFYTKAINSLTGEDVRISKRAYLSSRRLRGFESGKVGPKDGSDFIGGNYATSLNLSTTLPELLKDLQNLDFKLFYDVGNVWGVDYNSSLDNSKIRSSTGISIDWYTPIGPLSFSIAQPITKADSDITEKFRFDIGTTF